MSPPRSRPSATVSLEPTGLRSASPRQHAVKVTLRLSSSDTQKADKAHVAGIARRALAAFAPAAGAPDERTSGDVVETTTSSRKTGAPGIVVGVEASATWAGRPADGAVEKVRDALLGEGYRVTVRERRECAELGCKVDAILDWNHASEVPRGWYSNQICGAHNYRTCSRCGTTYALSSTNAVGPAPSVHCEVCGLVIIEWGSSKIWHAQLVTRAAN